MSEQKWKGRPFFMFFHQPLYFRLFFILMLLQGCSKFAVAGSAVKFLPGFEGPLPFELETGYIGVGESEDVQLFYYFVKSESNPEVDPLVLWLTGGPGCSTLTALLYEFGKSSHLVEGIVSALQNIGPIKFEEVEYNGSLPRLILNTNSWTEVASFIFLDFPVGTGFSYARTPDALQSNTLQACNQALEFLRKFLIDHPEFISNPFYVGGDSFSGLIVPIITELISEGNENGIEPSIDLKGYLIGNPVTTPTDDNYRVPFAHGMGLISDELYESLKRNCKGKYQDIDPSNFPCSQDLQVFNKLLDNIQVANILEPTCDFWAPNPRNLFLEGSLDKTFLGLNRFERFLAFRCRADGYKLSYAWANDDNVHEALQIHKESIGYWRRCNYGLPYTTTVQDCVPYHANLSSKGYRSLMYSGDHDFVVPFFATQAWIRSLNYPIIDDWRQWVVEGQVAGYTRSYANRMTFATVKGGGHTAPEYRPAECKAMFKRWISHEPL
nr:serine carboxypeptidase-like 11 isoform X1 [Coffea arabica]